MIKPRRLSAGDRLAVVAPASPFERAEFDRGLDEIRRLGFEPIFADSVFDRRSYVAGTPLVRVEAIHAAWRDDEIAGLIAVRGGYGSAQLLPLLDAALARQAQKPFIGYSDTTAILTFLTQQCGLVAYHGPMLDRRLSRGTGGYDRDSFERVLCRPEPAGEFSPEGLQTLRHGEAAGPLLGGTVTQLLASLGTPFAFAPPHGFVLFFDEVSERPYRLDRMVTQLQQSGILARAAAIVIGQLPGCDEPAGTVTGRGVMAELLREFAGPVLFGFPSGHTVSPLVTLPFGVRVRVVADARPRVIVEEAAVA